jgi:hypothetical protein
MLVALPTNIDYAGKSFPGINTLAYYDSSQITDVKKPYNIVSRSDGDVVSLQEVSDDLGRIEKRLSPRDAIDADVVFDARLDRQKCRMSTGCFHGTNAE